MSAQPQPHAYTVEEYLELDRDSPDARYEYYDGYIRLMAGGTNRHHLICTHVLSVLDTALADGPCSALTSDCRVQIDAARYVYPDVTVTCDPADLEGDIVRAPVVVFEVLSPSTEAFDRGRKADYYRMVPSLLEYVLIEQNKMSVQVQRRFNNSNLWTLENYGEGDSITFTSVNVTIALATIYHKIIFPPATGPSFLDTP